MLLYPTIWLEIHIKLSTTTKLFCSCPNVQEFDGLEANTHICPVCMGHPGALPVLQQKPLRKAILLWCVLGCSINNYSQFDRKSYFYPDLPLGYQITQLYRPLNTDGQVTFFIDQYNTTRTIRIQQAHLETDTGKTIHHDHIWQIDYNRAWSPLVEIVTRPDFHDPLEVSEFLKELQRTLRYNHISDADLEKWQMRCDVNISLAPQDSVVLGTRVELKNINSFWAIRRAIVAECERQTIIIQQWGTVSQETRRRDDMAGRSIAMRSKSDAIDYRYFPDPDLPLVMIDDLLIAEMRSQVQPTGTETILRYRDEYGFHKEYINGLLTDTTTKLYFEQLVTRGYNPKLTAKWICWPIAAYMTKHLKDITLLPFGQSAFMLFLDRIGDQTISDHQAKIIMELMLEGSDDVDGLIQSKGFGKQEINADWLRVMIQDVLTQHSHVVDEYRGGKVAVLGFLLGAAMKATGGSISPQDARAVLLECLG